MRRIVLSVVTMLITCQLAFAADGERVRGVIGTRGSGSTELVNHPSGRETKLEPLSAKAPTGWNAARETMAHGYSQRIVAPWPAAYHQIEAYGIWGDWVELEDGTTFVVASSGRRIVEYWAEGDVVHVLPNHGWFFRLFQPHEFCLYNQTTGETVEVDLTGGRGPLLNGYYSYQISAIDDHHGILYLHDGTTLQVASSDINTMYDWEPYDYIVIGTSDFYNKDRYPYIIINVSTVDYVRVSPVYY
jgi:hypothetical protein